MSIEAKGPVTAADVARKLGLSQSTVSAVIRGEAETRRISPETQERVLRAARSLGYVPNHLAQGLRNQRTGMIGVVVGNFSWGWTEDVINGMLDVFRPGGYMPFVAIHEFDEELARNELLSCLKRRDEGVVCLPLPELEDVFRNIQDSGIPLVFVGDRPASMADTSFVGWDSGHAARVAVEHLVNIGRKKIAFIGTDYPMEMNLARTQAYFDVLRGAGLPQRDDWTVIWPFRTPLDQIVSGSVARLFGPGREWPDAIFAVNDAAGASVMEEIEMRGVRVPDDVAVIGLGDLPMSRYRGIGLSTVKEPCAEMGRQAAQMILRLIQDVEREPICRSIRGTDLKCRRSTQVRPGSSDQQMHL